MLFSQNNDLVRDYQFRGRLESFAKVILFSLLENETLRFHKIEIKAIVWT